MVYRVEGDGQEAYCLGFMSGQGNYFGIVNNPSAQNLNWLGLEANDVSTEAEDLAEVTRVIGKYQPSAALYEIYNYTPDFVMECSEEEIATIANLAAYMVGNTYAMQIA